MLIDRFEDERAEALDESSNPWIGWIEWPASHGMAGRVQHQFALEDQRATSK